jgi:hypothetical protein
MTINNIKSILTKLMKKDKFYKSITFLLNSKMLIFSLSYKVLRCFKNEAQIKKLKHL